jgi:hypothetical protein
MDYSKPNPWWIVALFIAGIFGIAAYVTTGWLRYLFGLISFLSGTYGSVEFAYWFSWGVAGAIDAISTAKVAGATALAYAVKDLNNRQLELVANHDIPVIDIEAGLTGPAYFIVGIKYGRIPYDFGVEFMEAAQETYPYLLAIRNNKHEDWATDLTNKIVMLGLAEPAAGNRPAKLIKPLETVAYQFGIVVE